MSALGIEWPEEVEPEPEDRDEDSESSSSSESSEDEGENESEPDREMVGGAGEAETVEKNVKVEVLADGHGVKAGADALVPAGTEGWVFQWYGWAIAFKFM